LGFEQRRLEQNIRDYCIVTGKRNLISTFCKKILYLHISQIFKRATNHISASRYPTLAAAVPVYNWLMNNIEDFRNTKERSNDVKEAAQKAFDKLSEYYSKTDSSVYTIMTSKRI
jgi:hemoglobin-like flavoprotein